MRTAFVVNNLNKGKYVYRAAAGALAQNIPCEVIISDAQSTDNSWEEIERAVKEAPRGAKHSVRALQAPVTGKNTFESFGEHFAWIVDQTDAEWILQCSSDDYSFPDRARLCMQAADQHKCVAVATNMQMLDPADPSKEQFSGMAQDGYVAAGFGLRNLVFGSCIAGYKREWLKKVGSFSCTPDVYYGYLAALDDGYYVVASPQHAHWMAADEDNLGFQGKMRAAEKSGDAAMMARINELNRFQLFKLYYLTKVRQQQLYPLAHAEDQNALVEMLIQQAVGWYTEREVMNRLGIAPLALA